MRKHKSTEQKKLIANRDKRNYSEMEPGEKRCRLEKAAAILSVNYKSMDQSCRKRKSFI
jgi:hypothetical protein